MWLSCSMWVNYMKAIVTGASSGIGRDICRVLAGRGYTVYGVARRKDKLEELKDELGSLFMPVAMDLSLTENIYALFELVKNEKISILVNNAGLGVYGSFVSTNLDRELNMININIRTLHILTKLFVKKFAEQGEGRILNVASSAGFMMGPLLSSYYASKAYVLRLSEAVDEEVRRQNKNVTVSVLCPGPVKTEFDMVADVSSSLGGLESSFVAEYGVKKMLRGKRVIIPGFSTKMLVFFSRFVPGKILSKITYKIQSKKAKKSEM